jgi:hypothetical protein
MGPLARFLGGLLLTGWPLLAAWPASLPYRVDRSQSVLAVIIHPAGVAGGLGHSHLITAPVYRSTLKVDEGQITASRFQVTLPAAELEVDPPAVATALEPRLRLSGLMEGAFPRLSADQRAATREHMLSAGQLDAKAFPVIEASVAGLRQESAVVGGREFQWLVELTLTVRGRRITHDVPADISWGNGRLRATALGQFRFSEFGIEPYRAALGLLQNADDFHVYVELAADAGQKEGK